MVKGWGSLPITNKVSTCGFCMTLLNGPCRQRCRCLTTNNALALHASSAFSGRTFCMVVFIVCTQCHARHFACEGRAVVLTANATFVLGVNKVEVSAK